MKLTRGRAIEFEIDGNVYRVPSPTYNPTPEPTPAPTPTPSPEPTPTP